MKPLALMPSLLQGFVSIDILPFVFLDLGIIRSKQDWSIEECMIGTFEVWQKLCA